uniref:Uncharacterized protein n=1 Tax=Timema cristinae TaxID=61476 RepID=A0A7R9GQY7_TIMCR|nr:unnamed protein product [Timema cristinae]
MMSSAIDLKNWCCNLVNLFANEEKLFYHLKDLLDELSKIKPSIPNDLGVVLDHLTLKEFLTNDNPSILTLLAMIFSQLHRYINLVEYSSQENLQKIMHLLNRALICFEERFSKKLLEELIDSHILNLCHEFTDENTRVEWIVNILSTCINCTDKITGSDTKDLIFKLLKHFLEKMRRKHVHIRILDKLYGYIIKKPNNTHEVEMVSKLLNACYARLEMKTKEEEPKQLQENTISPQTLFTIIIIIIIIINCFQFMATINSGEEERKIGIWFTCNFLQSHPSMRGECLDYLKRRSNDDEVEVVLLVIDGLHRAVCLDPTMFSDDTQPLNMIAELALHHEEFNVRKRAIKTLAHVHHKYKHEEKIASSQKILVWIRNTVLKHCISRPSNRDRSVVDNMWTMYLVNPHLSPGKRMDTLLQIWVSLDEDAQAGYHKLALHHIKSVVDNMWTMYLVNPHLSPGKRMDTLLQIWVSLDEDAQAGYHKLALHHIKMRSLLSQLLEILRKPECKPEDESAVENLVHLISDQLDEQENDIKHVEKIVHLLEEDQSLQELIEQLLHLGIMCCHSEIIYEVFFEYPHLGFGPHVLRFLTMLVKRNTYEVFFEYPHLGFGPHVLRFLTMLVKRNTYVLEVLKIICLLSKHTYLESLFKVQFNEILVSKLKFVLINGPIKHAKYAAEFFARRLMNREDEIFQLVNHLLEIFGRHIITSPRSVLSLIPPIPLHTHLLEISSHIITSPRSVLSLIPPIPLHTHLLEISSHIITSPRSVLSLIPPIPLHTHLLEISSHIITSPRSVLSLIPPIPLHTHLLEISSHIITSPRSVLSLIPPIPLHTHLLEISSHIITSPRSVLSLIPPIPLHTHLLEISSHIITSPRSVLSLIPPIPLHTHLLEISSHIITSPRSVLSLIPPIPLHTHLLEISSHIITSPRSVLSLIPPIPLHTHLLEISSHIITSPRSVLSLIPPIPLHTHLLEISSHIITSPRSVLSLIPPITLHTQLLEISSHIVTSPRSVLSLIPPITLHTQLLEISSHIVPSFHSGSPQSF